MAITMVSLKVYNYIIKTIYLYCDYYNTVDKIITTGL